MLIFVDFHGIFDGFFGRTIRAKLRSQELAQLRMEDGFVASVPKAGG
jgi:hypothetical protein